MFTRSESFREFIRFYPIVSIIITIHIISISFNHIAHLSELLVLLKIFPA